MRTLFCIGINQNFFDLPADGKKHVFEAFGTMLADLAALPGIEVIADLDDDQSMVGPSATYPWTSYVLADADDLAAVAAACSLFRTTGVGPPGDDTALWRYAKVEARVGRPLTSAGSTTLSVAEEAGR
ncbi:hypothetical protein GTR02_01030 [Kineococcus sp. R8]|nr:hypothetical protein [Kineococcus siccus]